MKKVNLTVIQKARPMDADLHLAYGESISREALSLIRGDLEPHKQQCKRKRKHVMQYAYLQGMDIAAAITILYSPVLTNCVILPNL